MALLPDRGKVSYFVQKYCTGEKKYFLQNIDGDAALKSRKK